MVEPSPPALHLHANGDVSMVGIGVKLEEEESGEVGGAITRTEPQKSSPVSDWSGHLPVARQLTPPLSCSPSVSPFSPISY